ncbi:MAG: serine/threonine protein kinase [Myxococcales bacterium]|nr:serine/threonine protein kinase [Myxococcales bacterium]
MTVPPRRRQPARVEPVETEPNSASSSSLEVSFTDDIGRTIAARYLIQEVIGEGGMGVVYEAHDARVDRQVAIKLVRRECLTDTKFIIRFRRELEVTSQLRHPSTIRVYEHGETEDGRPYMVMELLTGQSMAERLEQGRIPEYQALQFAKQIAESLSEAHEHGIFHRDLKPDNIFIETVGVTTLVKVLDFGIAGGLDAMKLTRAGEVFGTPQYMSPEQCNGGDLDHRTDIYSLGCILYEMIEGKPPFSAESPMATMLKHVRAKIPTPRHAAPATVKLLQLALRKDRSKRIQTAGRFAELIGQALGAVRAAEEGRPVPELSGALATSAVNTGPFAPVPAAAGRPAPMDANRGPEPNRTPLILIGIGALGLLATIIMLILPDSPPAPSGETPAADGKNAEPPQDVGLPLSRPLIRSNVEGAAVYVDGVFVGNTPCEAPVPVGDNQAHEIRLKKDGYIDVFQSWRPLTVTDTPPPFSAMLPVASTIQVKGGKKNGKSP